MSSAIFDCAHFSMMTGADGALQRELIALFEAQRLGWRESLVPGAAPDALAMIAHTIKGGASGLGLFALAKAAEELETAPSATALAGVLVALDEASAALKAVCTD